MSEIVLGLSCYYHDSAAALVCDGAILAAAQEERFTRVKNDAGFPVNAARYCLEAHGMRLSDVDRVVYYENPEQKFDRIVEGHLTLADRRSKPFRSFLSNWLGGRISVGDQIVAGLRHVAQGDGAIPPLFHVGHHHAHAASAFFPSGFEDAAVLCMDGVGEWATTTAWRGTGGRLEPLWEIRFPHSLGLLYSAFTDHAGFEVNSGEYKLMGLAPYGQPRYVDIILDRLIDIKEDGSFQLDLRYFDYVVGETMTTPAFDALFGPARRPDQPLTQRDVDLARSIQVVTEEIVLRLARRLRAETGAANLCLAGGVALNCVANGRLACAGVFDRIWVQPAAGDAGGALGAALLGCSARPPADEGDAMQGALLGPAWSQDEVVAFLTRAGARFDILPDDAVAAHAARRLEAGQVIGWFQGRMEFGPRALGARSILADPRPIDMQSRINRKIKFRESFRPFAPAVLQERLGDYFDGGVDNPYMQFTLPIREERRKAPNQLTNADFSDLSRRNLGNSEIPAVTHVDYSARVQSVSKASNPKFHRLISEFEKITGCGLVVNTSFNVKDEPIVCSPEDAYRCFLKTGLDSLVIENCILDKAAA